MLLEFASDTSHELRTPLTVITGYLDLIRRRKTGQIDDETLDNLSKEATRLDRNISSLLTMLEVEAIEDESLHPINLSAILEEELDSFKVIESGREVTTEIAQGVWVIGSEELVLKLIRNILANIRRHTGSKCSVRTRLYIEEKSAVFTIEDGGPLPADQSLNLDDYLTRFSSSRSFSKGGSGLGFNIMNKSVEKLSGTMELFASPMGGFGIKLQIPQL
jgi:signal transduction histidine kinase